MSFYVRKGFNFGPLRLNLSRSGLGASFGVKGARIGIGPRGRYIHLGRGGIYYRQSLEPSGGHSPPQRERVENPPIVDSLRQITSVSAVTLKDSSDSDLLSELNRVQNRIDRCPIVAILGALFMVAVGIWSPSWWLAGPLILVTAAAIYARQLDVLRGTAVLQYGWEQDSIGPFSQLQATFRLLCECQSIWHINAAGHTDDWKRNAGANTLNKRSVTRPSFALPPKVQCNLQVPTLKASARTLYFFPDRLLIYDSSGVGALSYRDLKTASGQTRFVEADAVPKDAPQVGTTWRYVNRDGGPDRRFNNNRLLPVMIYGNILLTSDSGLRELFAISVPSAASRLESALLAMQR